MTPHNKVGSLLVWQCHAPSKKYFAIMVDKYCSMLTLLHDKFVSNKYEYDKGDRIIVKASNITNEKYYEENE